MASKAHHIISVTGTKGKTSLIRLLEFILADQRNSLVRVDTTGAYHNGKQIYSDDQSRSIWGYASANMPGRFLALHNGKPGLSILECTLFCATTGLGYKRHDIGVFTNVFEDHVGAFPGIQSSKDVAAMKSFIFSRIAPGGWAIFNADDQLVRGELGKLPQGIKTVAVTLNENLDKHMFDYIAFVKDQKLTIANSSQEVMIEVDARELTWLDVGYKPSVYLALFALSVIFAHSEMLQNSLERMKRYSFDVDGGRMIRETASNGATVLFDSAHEKVSLQAIANYAGKYTKPGGKVVGVLRFAPSRSEKLLRETASSIYDYFDEFIVYDKVDGYLRKPQKIKGYKDKQEEVGRIAEIFSDFLRHLGPKPVHTIIREDLAIEKAIQISCNNDVVVYIVGDNPKRSRQFLHNSKPKEQI